MYPTLRMTCEPRAIVGGVGAAAGVVPWLITSGLYTWIWPFGARIVASMNTPSVPPLAQVQPSPSSHGVARPLAVSGRFGTVTVQFVESAASAWVWVKLNAFPAASTAFEPARPRRPAGLMGGMPATVTAAAAGADAAAEPDAAADGQGAGAAEADAGALAPAAALAARGRRTCAGGCDRGAGAGRGGRGPLALAAAEAQLPSAACSTVVVLPPETARMIPRVRPSAIGMARGTAMRAARLLPRRRHADLCPLSIQSTSMWEVPVKLPVHHGRPARSACSANSEDPLHVRLF